MRNTLIFGFVIFAFGGCMVWRSVSAPESPEPLQLRAGVPIGFLGYPVGTRIAVEGHKSGFNTALQVTMVNGKALPEPVIVWTLDHILPAEPIRLAGYEKPMMIGEAPAEVPAGKVSINPHPWSLASEFVVLPEDVPATRPASGTGK